MTADLVSIGMHPAGQQAAGPGRRTGRAAPGGPAWRALLEARWRVRLQEVTELSVAYHDAAAELRPEGDQVRPEQRRLMQRAVAARRALADTEEALSRLAEGRYGRCETCSAGIPRPLLARLPEARYCPRCGGASGAGPAALSCWPADTDNGSWTMSMDPCHLLQNGVNGLDRDARCRRSSSPSS